ncbi:MAG: flippase, partial [Chloroflexota bacterium]
EEQVDVHLVNGNFRGILLEEGNWSVRFRYSPSSFWLGGLASVMGVIILVFAGVVIVWQRFSGETSEQSMVQRLAKNSVAPMVLNLFNKGIDFAFALYYLRVLGPADTGSYQTAITTAVLFEIISNFGLDILLIRDVSQAREKSASYLLNSTVLRLGMGLIAAMPILLFIFGTRLIGDSSFTQAEIIATILIMSGMVFSGMSKGITGLFYVYEQAEVPATMATVTTILKVGFGVIVLLLGFSFVGLAAVSILVNIITLAALAAIALRRFAIQGPWRVDWPLQREMLVKGWPLMLIHLLQTVFISIDVVLLRLQLPTTGQTVVGWYSTAYKWFNALQIIPSFFTLALFPVISRELKNSFESARNMYQLSLKLMLLLALPISAVTFYLAYPLTRILSGEEFLPHGAIALQIVILSIPFGWLNSVTNYVLIGLGLEDKQPRAFAIAVGFNIITNLLFIPMFTYRAAAVTTILSELVLMGVFAYYLRTKMANVDWLGLLLRPLLLTAIMFGGLYLGGQLHMLVGLIFGAAIYLGGLFLFNIIGQQEKEVLASILPDPLARRLR